MQCMIQTEKVKSVRFEGLTERLDFARYLLVQTVESLETIAARCGWGSRKMFTDAFHTQVGVSPEDYRRWHQG